MGLNCGLCILVSVAASALKMVAAGAVSLAGEDREDGGALPLVGALVDDCLRFAVAVMDRARPGEQRRPMQSVEPDLAEMPLVDAHRHRRAAVAPAREGVELTGAAPVTTAGAQFRSLDAPVDVSHRLACLHRFGRPASPVAATVQPYVAAVLVASQDRGTEFPLVCPRPKNLKLTPHRQWKTHAALSLHVVPVEPDRDDHSRADRRARGHRRYRASDSVHEHRFAGAERRDGRDAVARSQSRCSQSAG